MSTVQRYLHKKNRGKAVLLKISHKSSAADPDRDSVESADLDPRSRKIIRSHKMKKNDESSC
jgi:hypothetical protein